MSFADKLSVARIILVPFFVSLLIYSRAYPYLKYVAVGIFILAMLSDFFDGLVARIKKEKSEIGIVIDPAADKLLLLVAFVTLYFLRESLPVIQRPITMPLGVVIVVVSRDLTILVGFILLKLLKVDVPIAPSLWGKLTTFFQMFTILAILLEFKWASVIWTSAVIFTLVSGVGYLVRGVRSINAGNISR